ncbi:MAG: FecR domain-containing protein [Pirellulaceae bacterium]
MSALCDGALDAAGQRELEHLLRESAQCRSVYLQYVDMHARLSAHPNLSSGIPFEHAAAPSNADGHDDGETKLKDSAADDAIVLELARASLGRLTEDARRCDRGRRFAVWGRWLSLGLLLLIGVVVWQFYLHWERGRFPIVREVVGAATFEIAGVSAPVRIGHRLQRGERLRTDDEFGRAVLQYNNGTEIVVCFDSQVEIPRGESDVHLRLVSGTMEVDAAPQPPDRPMVFATDHARYVVLGTRFRLYRETEATRLELGEGKVRLEREVDGQTLDVAAGYVAVASSETTPLQVQPLASARSKLRATLKKAGEAVAFSARGDVLATADWQRGLRTWRSDETDSEHPLAAVAGKIGRSDGFVYTDSKLVHINDGKEGAVTCWRPEDKQFTVIPLAGESPRSRALSPDGRFAAESDNAGTHLYALDPKLGRCLPLADLPNRGKAWCLSLSRSAKYVAAGYWDGTVLVHRTTADSETDDEPSVESVFETRLAHTPIIIALAEDGRRMAVYSRKDGLLLVDLTTGERRLLWAAGSAGVTCVKFAADGERMLAGLGDGTARMWSVADGEALLVIDVGQAPRDIAWSEEQSLFVTASGKVNLWECVLP